MVERPLPPEPSLAELALLRAAGAWPLDGRGYARDPQGGGRMHWSVLVELLRRDEREARLAKVVGHVLGGEPGGEDDEL